MSLAFIPQETTSPDYTVWALVNMEMVEFTDGPRAVPGEIFGSVLVPSLFNEAEARAAFHRKKAANMRLLDTLDRLAGDKEG